MRLPWVAAETEHRYEHTAHPRTHLLFPVAGHRIGLRVAQPNERTEHVPTAREQTNRQRYGYDWIPNATTPPASG